MPVLFWKRRRYFAQVLSSTVQASTGYRPHSAVPIACHTPTGVSYGARNPMKTPLLHKTCEAVDAQPPDISEPLRYLVAIQKTGSLGTYLCCIEGHYALTFARDGVQIGRAHIGHMDFADCELLPTARSKGAIARFMRNVSETIVATQGF
jgi:hypothetical protein